MSPIYLFLTVLGLCCCMQTFSSCGEPGLLFIAVHGLLIAGTSLVEEHGLQARGLQQLWLVGFSSCGTRAQQLWLAGSRAQAQQLWHMDLVAPRHVGSSRTRARTHVPCIGRRILNHCAPREVRDISEKYLFSIFYNHNLLTGFQFWKQILKFL